MNLFTSRQPLAGTVACFSVAAIVTANAAWEASSNDDIARALPSIAGLPALAVPAVAVPPPLRVAQGDLAVGERAAHGALPMSRRQVVAWQSRAQPASPLLAALPAPAAPESTAPFSTAQFDYTAAKRLAHQQAWVRTMHERIARAEQDAERNHWQERDLARLDYMRAKAARAEAREAYLLERARYRAG